MNLPHFRASGKQVELQTQTKPWPFQNLSVCPDLSPVFGYWRPVQRREAN